MTDDERRPNLTVSDPNTEPSALPRDPSQKIHKKPRVFIHRASEDPEEEERAYKNLSMLDAAKTVSIEDFKKVHQTPCFRDAMLPGIGLGSGVGALRFVVGGSFPTALNFAVGSGLAVALGTYQYCQGRRRRDKEGIRQAVKVLDEKQAMKEAHEAKTAASKGLATSKSPPVAPTAPEQKSTSLWSTFKFW